MNFSLKRTRRAVPICMIIISVMCLSPCGAGASGTIKIASIYSFTGTAAEMNRYSVEGVRFAVQEINSRGGLLGKQLELVEFDNLSMPIGSKVAAERAAKAGVKAIIGPCYSSHSLAVAKVAQAHKIPMITDTSTNTDVTRIGHYIFRACYTDDYQGRVVAQFARKDLRAATAVLFVNLTSDYSMGLAREFRSNFQKMGGRVLSQIHYRRRQDHFHTDLLKSNKVSPDVIFIPGFDESVRIIQEAVRFQVRAVPLGGDAWSPIDFRFGSGSYLETGYYCTHWAKEIDSAASQDYLLKRERYADIQVPEVLAYDAVRLLAHAIEKAGIDQRHKIRNALAETQAFQGITGTFSFDEHGDPVKEAVIMKIDKGKKVYLKSLKPAH